MLQKEQEKQGVIPVCDSCARVLLTGGTRAAGSGLLVLISCLAVLPKI